MADDGARYVPYYNQTLAEVIANVTVASDRWDAVVEIRNLHARVSVHPVSKQLGNGRGDADLPNTSLLEQLAPSFLHLEEPTQLVAKRTLQRRHPDLIWSADTVQGGRVMFLIEFQRTAEWLMALRTTTYTALTLERIVGGEDFRTGAPLPEFVYLVLYDGDGPWNAPARVADLFRRSDPGRFRLVSWREAEGAGRPRDDITSLVLGLARNLSPEDMAAQLAALRLTVEGHGDAGLNAFMVERVDTVLTLRDYPEELKLGGAKTMAEMVDRFQQGLDELVQRGRAQVLRRDRSRTGSARRRPGGWANNSRSCPALRASTGSPTR